MWRNSLTHVLHSVQRTIDEKSMKMISCDTDRSNDKHFKNALSLSLSLSLTLLIIIIIKLCQMRKKFEEKTAKNLSHKHI